MTNEEMKMLEQRWTSCKYKPEYDEALIKHLSRGYSFMSFSVDNGVSYRTLINWCKRFPSFQEAREIGEKARLMLLEQEGLKMVRGGNVVAWKFMMNQLGLRESTDVNHNHSGTVGAVVSPHMQVSAPVRYKRLQKLKELNQRVRLEDEMLEGEVVDVEPEDDSDLENL